MKAIRHASRYRTPYLLLAAWLAMVVAAPTVPVRTAQPASDFALPPLAGPAGQEPTSAVPPEGEGAANGAAEGAGGATVTTGLIQNRGKLPSRNEGAIPGPSGNAGNAATVSSSGAPMPGSGAAGSAQPSTSKNAPPPTADSAAPAGPTRGGVECRAGVRQFDSAYAAPCRPRWTGSNGGATNRGVTADSVKIVLRGYGDSPDNVFLKQVVAQGGFAPEEVTAPVRRVFADYFNRTYELYGRRVIFDEYTSNGSMFKELFGEGREVACADAAAIAEERKAFGVLPAFAAVGPGGSGLAAFSDCAVERRLLLPVGTVLAPETWFRRAHPYAWGVQPDCERIALQYAEYVGKRLAGRPARFARDPLFTAAPRVFGLMTVDGGFRPCSDLLQAELEKRYGVRIASRYNYGAGAGNDPSVLPRQAAQAVVQFKAAGVTTLVMFGDAFTFANITSHARSQRWGPEWVIHGVGNMDNEGFARLFDQDRVNGHLFGTSFIGSPTRYQGPTSEPARLYKQLTGKSLPQGTDGDYYTLVHTFNLLQNAGPTLTPETIATGVGSLPPGGAPHFDLGGWNFRTRPDGVVGLDHTAMDDAREVYWDGDATGADGKKGTFVATYSGRRFAPGQWPAEDPPVYPAGCTGTCQRTAAADHLKAWQPDRRRRLRNR